MVVRFLHRNFNARIVSFNQKYLTNGTLLRRILNDFIDNSRQFQYESTRELCWISKKTKKVYFNLINTYHLFEFSTKVTKESEVKHLNKLSAKIYVLKYLKHFNRKIKISKDVNVRDPNDN